MKIFEYLRKTGKSTVNGIVEFVSLTQPTISYHLKEMKMAGLLEIDKSGKEVFYSIKRMCPSRNGECVLNKVKLS